MTDEQAKTVSDFESRVHHLMYMYDRLKQTNTELIAENDAIQTKIKTLTEENTQWQAKYKNLLTARIIEVKREDFTRAKQQIDSLVNKIDDCIRILNG
jgi:regulator of replication initiation timing